MLENWKQWYLWGKSRHLFCFLHRNKAVVYLMLSLLPFQYRNTSLIKLFVYTFSNGDINSEYKITLAQQGLSFPDLVKLYHPWAVTGFSMPPPDPLGAKVLRSAACSPTWCGWWNCKHNLTSHWAYPAGFLPESKIDLKQCEKFLF